MRTRLVFGVLLVASLGLAVTTSGKPAKPPLGTPVTVTLPNYGTGFAIEGDGGAYIDGVDGVTALIVPLGNLQLKTGDVRAFWLDFGLRRRVERAARRSRRLHAGIHDHVVPPEPLPGMEVLDSQYCNLNVHFTADGWGWFIRFGEYQTSTTPANVTRHSGTSWRSTFPRGSPSCKAIR